MLLALCVLLSLLAVGVDAQGGSIFMKNGYIIQGQIVERSDDSYILGWPNGKVTIARRFVESVSYDPGEERRLDEEEKLQRELQAAAPQDDSFLATGNDTVELPSTLEELMESYGTRSREKPGSGSDELPPPAIDLPPPDDGSTDPDTDAVTTPNLIPPPSEGLGDRVDDTLRSLSLKPPAGWTLESTPEALVVRAGEPDPDGFRPSLNVVVLPGGVLGAKEYAHLLREENEKTLQNYEILEEGPREVGTRDAFQLVSRGTYAGQTALVRQILVVDGSQVWLLSSFTKDQSEDPGFQLTEESLKTFEFTVR